MSNPKPTNEVLANMIENLIDQVNTGFKGVHDRQDKTNGNVKENTAHRLKYEQGIDELLKNDREEKTDKLKRYTDIAWKLGISAAGVALGVSQFL